MGKGGGGAVFHTSLFVFPAAYLLLSVCYLALGLPRRLLEPSVPVGVAALQRVTRLLEREEEGLRLVPVRPQQR